MKRRERTHGRLGEFAVLVGDVFHLDDHLQRNVLLSHRQHLHRFCRTADNGFHFRLAENVQDGVCAESLIRGDECKIVGVAGLLGNAPLQSVAGEDSQTLVLHLSKVEDAYSVVLRNKIQLDQTRSKVLNTLPDFVVGDPYVVACFSFSVLFITLMRESVRSDDIRSKGHSGKYSFHAKTPHAYHLHFKDKDLHCFRLGIIAIDVLAIGTVVAPPDRALNIIKTMIPFYGCFCGWSDFVDILVIVTVHR